MLHTKARKNKHSKRTKQTLANTKRTIKTKTKLINIPNNNFDLNSTSTNTSSLVTSIESVQTIQNALFTTNHNSASLIENVATKLTQYKYIPNSPPTHITYHYKPKTKQPSCSFISKRHLTTTNSTTPIQSTTITHSISSPQHALNDIEMMSHSPQQQQYNQTTPITTQQRGFQTKYNTQANSYDNSQPLTKYNVSPTLSRDYGKKEGNNYNNNNNNGGVYTSSHFKLTRETITNYLTRKNLTFKHSGDKTIIMECPLCPKPSFGKPDNLWKLCVFDNGAFVCLRCQSKGSWFDFKSRLGDLPNIQSMSGKPIYQHHQQIEANAGIIDDNDINSNYIKNQQNEFATLSQADCAKMVENLDQSPQLLNWFENTRKIKRETLVKYKIGSTKLKFPELNATTKQIEWIEQECMTFPWTERKSATDENSVLYQRLKARGLADKKHMRLLPKGGSWGFFGWHTVPIQAKQIILTEGEIDAMSVYQTTGLPTISLPNGANSLPPALLPCLERFEKIILWLDDDQAGHAAVESMTQKLGVQRTYHIPGGYGAKDANEALQKGLNIGAILDTATRQQHKQISSFSSFRHEVKRMFYDPNTQVGVQYPNMPILQGLIKGHRRGELTILTGGTGVGKTTLLTQLSLELAQQGVNTLWGSFEIRNPRLAKTLMKQYAAVLGVVLNEQHPEAFDYIADKFEELPFNFLKFYGSSPVQEVIEAMEYATYVHDVQHIILDNLQFMLSGQGRGTGDKFDVQDKAIEAFRQFASQRNVHVTLVIHPRKEQDNSSLGLASVFGSAKATQEADNVMIIQGGLPRAVLRNIQLPDSGEGKKTSTQLKQSNGGHDLGQHAGFEDPIIGEIMGTFFRTIEIRKNRWDGDLGSVPLRFDKSSSRFYELTSDDISLGLGEFIAKQKKLKQLDLIRHMNQLPGAAGSSTGPTRSGFDNMAASPTSIPPPPSTPKEKLKAKIQTTKALAEHFSSGNLNAQAQQEIKQQDEQLRQQQKFGGEIQGEHLTQQQEEALQREFDQMFNIQTPSVAPISDSETPNTPNDDGDDVDADESGSGSDNDDGNNNNDDDGTNPYDQSGGGEYKEENDTTKQKSTKQAKGAAAGIIYGSPEAMAIRKMESKMLDDMHDKFGGTKTSSGNFENHHQFHKLQQKQQEFGFKQAATNPLAPPGGYQHKPATSTSSFTPPKTNNNNAHDKDAAEKSKFKKHTAPTGYEPTLDIVFE